MVRLTFLLNSGFTGEARWAGVTFRLLGLVLNSAIRTEDGLTRTNKTEVLRWANTSAFSCVLWVWHC